MNLTTSDRYEAIPIGHVETDVPDADIARQRRTLRAHIVIAPPYVPALLGIEDYSHLVVVFWMHRRSGEPQLVSHPRGDQTLPPTGAFAGRGRNHPNPIGLAVVELIGLSEGRLEVLRLDAYHGTPVIDIKPYDLYDVVAAPRVPGWLHARATRGNSPA